MVICLKQSTNDLHMVQLMPLPSHHLCFSKIQNGLSFWYWPIQVVLEKRPLNELCVTYNNRDNGSNQKPADWIRRTFRRRLLPA